MTEKLTRRLPRPRRPQRPQLRGVAPRLLRLYPGLALYALGIALMVRAHLGSMPWDVLHQGLARLLPLSLGAILTLTSALVLLCWIPLRQRPGLGTISNFALLGVMADGWLAMLPTSHELGWRITGALMGIVVNAVGCVLYISAEFGPGPRDGLMTGLVRRTGWPVWRIRTLLEGSVVIIGFALGGVFGVMTIVYALTVGPLVQLLIRLPGLSVAELSNQRSQSTPVVTQRDSGSLRPGRSERNWPRPRLIR